MTAQRTWQFPSSSSAAIYTVTHADNGLLSCSCRGWTFWRGDKPRECRHIKDVLARESLTRIVKGEFVFGGHDGTASVVVAGPRATAVSDATVNRALDLADGVTADGTLIDITVAPLPPQMSAPMPMLASIMVLDLPAQSPADVIMVATRAQVERIAAAGTHVLEEKCDGHRCEIVKRGTVVQGWSRPRAGGNGALPKELPTHIAAAARELPDGIYDGELLVPGGNSWDVPSMGANIVFVAFDVLEIMGESLLDVARDERRMALELAVAHVTSDVIVLVEQAEVTWAAVEAIWNRGGEGAILKRRVSTYRPGWRTPEWIKVVKVASAVMTVTGFIAAKSGPYSVLALAGPQPIKSVRTKDNNWMAEIATNPQAFIGRRIVIQYTPRGGKPMHPRVDHWAGAGE